MADSPLHLPTVFVTHAAGILGETSRGLSGDEIVKLTAAYAVDWGVRIPHDTYPFKLGLNKRTALAQNLAAFNSVQRYQIIRELCDHPKILALNRDEAADLKVQLFKKYGGLDAGNSASDLNPSLVEETRHLLDAFPESRALFDEAHQKHEHGVFTRNVLDDLRLSLELLLKALLGNAKSLENQLSHVGEFIEARGGSVEYRNMLIKLLDYYGKYQNAYVKHEDAVIGEEVIFVFELTACFMKHLVRIRTKRSS